MKGEQIRTCHKKARLLAALSENLGCVAVACRAAGIGRTVFYEWKRRDSAFAQRVEDLQEAITESAERELYRRAVEGWSEPVFYEGKVCGTVLKKSDTCLIFLLKGRKPSMYRQTQQFRADITLPTFVISSDMDDSANTDK